VAQTLHKSLALILAREFAANIATPVSVWDERGYLVFFNEPAEKIVGRPHAEVGELGPSEWTKLFAVERIDGSPVLLEEMPVGIAHVEKHPSHDMLAFTDLKGTRHEVEVTAFPLLGRANELLGVVAVYWERGGR
jgi:PAS domain-containing protein